MSFKGALALLGEPHTHPAAALAGHALQRDVPRILQGAEVLRERGVGEEGG